MIKKETFELMESIQQFFPHFEITQSKIDLWQRALNDTDYQTADDNLMKYVKANKYPPNISDLVAYKEERLQNIPGIEDTKKLLKSNRVENPVTEERIKEIMLEKLGKEWVERFEQHKRNK